MVSSGSGVDAEAKAATGMVLPFDPLALSFHDLCYYVPIPSVRLLWTCATHIVVSKQLWKVVITQPDTCIPIHGSRSSPQSWLQVITTQDVMRSFDRGPGHRQ